MIVLKVSAKGNAHAAVWHYPMPDLKMPASYPNPAELDLNDNQVQIAMAGFIAAGTPRWLSEGWETVEAVDLFRSRTFMTWALEQDASGWMERLFAHVASRCTEYNETYQTRS